MKISGDQCGDLLAMWLEKTCAPENIKLIAKEIGFNDSPLFGGEKKRLKIMSELLIAHTALAIFAVNQVFEAQAAKSIIDPFLAVVSKSIFSALEKKDDTFKNTYEQRMPEYFRILSEEKAMLGISFSLMQHLGLNPLKNMNGQLTLTTRLGDSLTKTIDVLKRMNLHTQNPLQEFEMEIESWPVKQAKAGLQLIQASLKGDAKTIDKVYGELTISQLRAVETVLRRLEEG